MWIIIFMAVILFECWIAQSGDMIIQSLGKNDDPTTVSPPSQLPPGRPIIIESPVVNRIFRAAPLPHFIFFFLVSLITAFAAFLPDLHFTESDIVFVFVLSSAVATSATFFIWRFMAEFLSAKGVEIWTMRGHRLLLWKEVSTVRSFPLLRLICLRFTSASGRSRRVLFVQRRAGEFREMIIDFVPRNSLIWTQLKDA